MRGSYDVAFVAVTRAQNIEWRERNGETGMGTARDDSGERETIR